MIAKPKELTKELTETREIECPYCHGNITVSIHCMSIPCSHCNQYINVNNVLAPPTEESRQNKVGMRELFCLKCGMEIFIDKNAQAVTCKHCYHGNDLSDYKVKTLLGQKLETHGTLYLKKKGIVKISSILVGNAVIKGKVNGDLRALGTVEIYKRGEIHGKITCRKLVVYKGGVFDGTVEMLNTSQTILK